MPKQKNDEPPQFYTRLPVLRTERGEYSPSLVLALKIAEALGVPLGAAFSLTPFPSMADQIYNEGR